VNGETYGGGHVSHTGNVFFPQEYNDKVSAASPYSENTAKRTQNTSDMVWNDQGGSAYVLDVTGSVEEGFVASISLGVDPTATPALVGITSSGGIGGPGGRPGRP
jgi:hypothetical protein